MLRLVSRRFLVATMVGATVMVATAGSASADDKAQIGAAPSAGSPLAGWAVAGVLGVLLFAVIIAGWGRRERVDSGSRSPDDEDKKEVPAS